MNKSDSMDIYDRLQKAINALAPTPNELIKQLYSICVERRISKGERFVEAGDIPKYMGLNLGGLFRFYYSDEKGNDFTKGFNKANQFLISYSAIVQKRPSYFNQMIQSDMRWYPFIF